MTAFFALLLNNCLCACLLTPELDIPSGRVWCPVLFCIPLHFGIGIEIHRKLSNTYGINELTNQWHFLKPVPSGSDSI